MRNIDRGSFGEVFEVQYPTSLRGASMCDCPEDPEAYEIVRDFEGVCWIDITSDFWYERESALNFFSGRACCYFLPSIIVSSYEDWSGMELVFESLLREWSSKESWAVAFRDRRWGGLKCLQRGCAIQWLLSLGWKKVEMQHLQLIKEAVTFLTGMNGVGPEWHGIKPDFGRQG